MSYFIQYFIRTLLVQSMCKVYSQHKARHCTFGMNDLTLKQFWTKHKALSSLSSLSYVCCIRMLILTDFQVMRNYSPTQKVSSSLEETS